MLYYLERAYIPKQPVEAKNGVSTTTMILVGLLGIAAGTLFGIGAAYAITMLGYGI